MQIFHNKQTNGFCRTRTNSDTQSHKTGQQVGDGDLQKTGRFHPTQPNESPLKKANTLNGWGSKPNNTRDNSATATDKMINRNRFFFFS